MNTQNDKVGIKLGMWLFLYTEIMLFGGLFVLYAAYYNKYLADFIEGGKQLNMLFGSFNTVILLVSSYCVAAAITAVQTDRAKVGFYLVLAAIVMGLVFLVNKYFEWGAKIQHGIYPGAEKLAEGPPKSIISV